MCLPYPLLLRDRCCAHTLLLPLLRTPDLTKTRILSAQTVAAAKLRETRRLLCCTLFAAACCCLLLLLSLLWALASTAADSRVAEPAQFLIAPAQPWCTTAELQLPCCYA
jgi:hypothetical protein